MTGHLRKGPVYLVGAGPGDPELITVKGRILAPPVRLGDPFLLGRGSEELP